MLRNFLLASALFLVALAACGPAMPENVVLKADAQNVEFATETPSPDAYSLVGTITSDTAGKEIDDAILSAKNDLRNKAAAMGATLVIVDETVPDKDFVREKRIVHLKGRAFKVKE
jgi:hypothetical protein